MEDLRKQSNALVKEMESQCWEDFYDSETISLTQAFPNPAEAKWFYNIHEWIIRNTQPKQVVLEVGCGVGMLSHLLVKNGNDVTGVDVSSKAVEHCKKVVPQAQFMKCYAEQLNFEDEHFDVVAATEVIEHLKSPEVAIAEMLRVLKPGGTLLVTVPIEKNFDNNGKSGHINYWNIYQIIELFSNFGSDFKVYYLNKFERFDKRIDEPFPKNIFGIKLVKNEVAK